VIPWQELGRARAPDGGELVLRQRGGDYEIRVDGHDLMSNRAHGSEEEMARLACAHVETAEAPRVLVGGLGMGYTLRATLDVLPAGGRAVVAEIVPAVVDWNRGPLAHLAGNPLADPRSEVHVGDVAALLRSTTVRYDAIMLDVDNGPQALTRKGNQLLYAPTGLDVTKRALRRGGVLAVWSSDRSKEFEARLRKAGFDAESIDVPARGKAGGPNHTIFVAKLP
jgi:spermidine synthase